jgi:hypothetical protein
MAEEKEHKEERRVKIVSNFESEAESFYERVEDPNTGEVEIQKDSKPHTVTSKTTIKTAPYKHEEDVLPKTRKDTDVTRKLATEKPGLDASEL